MYDFCAHRTNEAASWHVPVSFVALHALSVLIGERVSWVILSPTLLDNLVLLPHKAGPVRKFVVFARIICFRRNIAVCAGFVHAF